jgi:hypothetical protein
MQATRSFKLFFTEENIRRFTIVPTSFEEFTQLLQKLYPDSYHPEMTLVYQDSEGDRVSISSELEWQEMLDQFKDAPITKLSVSDKTPGKYFKDGPEPEVVKLVEVNKNSQQESPAEVPEGFEAKVTRAIENLFPSKKILPYNIPTFLSGVVSFETLGEQIGNLDVDISRLVDALHREAIRLMESTDKHVLTKARDLLLSQLIIQSENPVVLYNLACAEALIGNVNESFEWLQKAIQHGYSNLAHMCQDPDLVALRGREEWHKLVTSMKDALAPKEEVKVEEPVPVPAPVEVPKERNLAPELRLQLEVLHDMGFLDDSILIPSLQEFGSVDAALTNLLG